MFNADSLRFKIQNWATVPQLSGIDSIFAAIKQRFTIAEMIAKAISPTRSGVIFCAGFTRVNPVEKIAPNGIPVGLTGLQ